MAETEDKTKLIEKALKQLDEFSSGAVMLNNAQSNIDSFEDTGCYILNALLSGDLRGGFPEGRLSVMNAENSCGKSLIALQSAAYAQKKGKRVVVFDSENAIDKRFAASMGLDLSKVKYFPVESIEQCKNALYKFLKFIADNNLKGMFFIIIDSLGAMLSEMDYKRLDDENNATDMGTLARSMKQLMKVCTTMSAVTKTTILCTNHVYDDPNSRFPSIEKPTPGGKAIKYLASTIVQLSKSIVKEGDAKRGIQDESAGGSVGASGIAVRGVSIKNRVCKPYNEALMYISWNNGLSRYYGLFDLAMALGVITCKSAGRYYRTDTDEYIGTKKELQDGGEFWESFIPVLQKGIDSAWKYTRQELDIMEKEKKSSKASDDLFLKSSNHQSISEMIFDPDKD